VGAIAHQLLGFGERFARHLKLDPIELFREAVESAERAHRQRGYPRRAAQPLERRSSFDEIDARRVSPRPR
jgi:hypothetical protein